MTANDTNYRQRSLPRRALLRRAGAAAAGLGALALAGCRGKDKGDASMGGLSGGTGSGGKAELVFLHGDTPHVSVFDPQNGKLKRKADVPGLLYWAWNDAENFFDGKNLWAVGLSQGATADLERPEIILIDLDTLAVTGRIPIGKEKALTAPRPLPRPGLLNISRGSPDGRVFVTDVWTNEVSVLDTKSGRVVLQKNVEGATNIWDSDLGVADDGAGRLYIADRPAQKVLLLDPETLAVQKTYTATPGVVLSSLTVAPGGNRVWVTSMYNLAREISSVTVLDARTLDVVKRADTGRMAHYVTFSPDGRLAYIGHYDAPYVSVLDTESLAEVQRVELPMGPMVARYVAAHPDGRSIWILTGDWTVGALASWCVRVDTSSWKVTHTTAKTPRRFIRPPSGGYGGEGLYMRSG